MNQEIAIDIRDLTKTFLVERCRYGFKDILLHLPNYIRDLHNRQYHTVLDNLTLTIRRGERIGLTGRNGCGKTTLLSVIGGVYRRYTGHVEVNGRISMMLALGAGFCPDLSGRENIVLNGVLQGKTRQEMLDLEEDIISFADIGAYIDSPVRQYSSGMQARLGFGIITAIQPDILLVDEVMAVGDAAFREKCGQRINTLLQAGTTLILVSHNQSDIEKYCQREIALDQGQVIYDGPVRTQEK